MRTAILMVAGLAAATTACSGPAQPTDELPGSATVASVAISPPSIALQVGKTMQLGATARDSAGNALSNRQAVWSSSDTSVAQVSTSGMLAARKVGGTSIHVSIEGRAASAAVAVSPVPVASVSISPSTPSVQVGGTVQLSATARDAGGSTLTGRVITWSSANSGVATVNSSGLASGASAGTVTITASSEGKSGTATLTVTTAPPPPPAPVATVTVTLAASSLTVGQTTQASAVTRDASGNVLSGRTIAWSSSNTAIATVSSTGVVTAVAAGTANVTATSEGKTGSASLTVTAPPPAPVATVTVTLSRSSLTVGQSAQATAVVKDASGNLLTGRSIVWSSSSASVATVSGAGSVMAVAVGTASITATSEGKSGSASVTVTAVTPPPVSAVDTIFYDGFESGTLGQWDDGVNASKHRVITDATAAKAGSRYLQITYPSGGDGGWLTRFFMPGYDSVYVRYYVRFPLTWTGSTKLLLLRGSRTDNQWSSFGVAGKCPTGTDFFATNVIADTPGDPGPIRFYSYYPAMSREPDGVTCWGRYSGEGSTTYPTGPTMARGQWHLVEWFVKLNGSTASDAVQRVWVDGVLRGEWTGLRFRTSTILKLNSLTLEASAFTTSSVRTLEVDDVLVTTAKPSP